MYVLETIDVEPIIINEIYSKKYIDLDYRDIDPNLIYTPVNNYLNLRSPEGTALVRHIGSGQYQKILPSKKLNVQGLSPKDAKQAGFMDCLLDEKVLVNIAIGPAGTGKTTLALAYALEQYQNHNKNIVLSKPTVMVGKGKAFGPVPGDISEKYDPYLSSYEIVLKKLLNKKADSYIQLMKSKEALQYMPIELARGCTFDDCTFILDEAQNLTWHEMNTIISRMGENTKMIILGDLHQIDTGSRIDDTGLYKFINAEPTIQSPIVSCMTLTTQYRSPITELVYNVNKFLQGTD